MRLRPLNDVHNNWGILKVPEVDVDVEIWAGDIDEGRKLDKKIHTFIDQFPSDRPIIHVPGNHECWGHTIERAVNKLKSIPNPNYHCLYNDVVEIGNTTFIGTTLWTDYSAYGNKVNDSIIAQFELADFKYIKASGFTKLWPIHIIAEHEKGWALIKAESEKAKDKGNKVVVITHHAPSLQSSVYNDNLTPAYCNNFDNWICYNDYIDVWFHGHLHDSQDYMIGNTRVICNPRGYYPRELNENFNPALVVEL